MAEHGEGMRSALACTLGGPLADTAWWQASTGADHGGLGLRAACETALPAFLGPRAACRPLVATLLQRTAAARLCDADRLLQQYDLRTSAAWERFAASLPTGSAAEAQEVLRDWHASA